MSQRRALGLLLLLVAAAMLGCAPQLPREWRESLYGPDATPTAHLVTAPTPVPTKDVRLPTAAPLPTPQATLTSLPTRTTTATRTFTATPAIASLTLQQGVSWYVGGQFAPYEGVEDTYISAWSRNANYADAQVMSVRSGDIMAALVYFHLRDLSADTTINRAEMSFYVTGRSNDTAMTLKMWDTPKHWLLKETTWLKANHELDWQAPGAAGETDRGAESVGEVVANERGVWLTFDVTILVKGWIKNPRANEGVLLSGEATNAVQYDFASSDSKDLRHRPRLALTFPTGAIALAPAKAPSPTPTLTQVVDPNRPEAFSIARLLPMGSAVLARASGDVTGGESLDIVAAYRTAPSSGINLGVFYYPGMGSGPGDYRLYWGSGELAGKEPVSIDLIDLTGDGRPEILAGVANLAGPGRMLYVFSSRPAGFRPLKPIGGLFDGQDHFGDTWFELADANGDGKIDILARHGNQTDVYVWDGVNFAVR